MARRLTITWPKGARIVSDSLSCGRGQIAGAGFDLEILGGVQGGIRGGVSGQVKQDTSGQRILSAGTVEIRRRRPVTASEPNTSRQAGVG